MSIPSKVTASASALRRLPRQRGHSVLTMKRAARFFIMALSVFAKDVRTCRFALEKLPI